jgi:hypothetical protein
MEISQDEISQNIARLREKMGDARTGGKGTQRRKVKVVSKPQVHYLLKKGIKRQSREKLS